MDQIASKGGVKSSPLLKYLEIDDYDISFPQTNKNDQEPFGLMNQ